MIIRNGVVRSRDAGWPEQTSNMLPLLLLLLMRLMLRRVARANTKRFGAARTRPEVCAASCSSSSEHTGLMLSRLWYIYARDAAKGKYGGDSSRVGRGFPDLQPRYTHPRMRSLFSAVPPVRGARYVRVLFMASIF